MLIDTKPQQTAKAILTVFGDDKSKSACKEFRHKCAILSHPSCDEANCKSLKIEVQLNLTRQIPEQCHKHITVYSPCIKNEACTVNPDEVESKRLQTRLSFLGWDALNNENCKEFHGVVMRGTDSARNKDQGCQNAEYDAMENFQKYLGGKKKEQCFQYIATTPPSECVQYG